MPKQEIKDLFIEFLKNYNTEEKERIWASHSQEFRKFWKEKILSDTYDKLAENEIDEIIRILDRNGKGNTKESEAVAKAMIAQGAWRRMFYELHANKPLADTITNIFEESDPHNKAAHVDRLYEMNKGKKNNLTGQSGNAINAMLAAYDPSNNLSMISLKDRKMLIEYAGFPWTFSFDDASIGVRIIESNRIILQEFESLSISGSARTLSVFCYYPSFKTLWRGEHKVKRPDKDVAVVVPTDTDSEEPEVAEKDEERESIQIQCLLAEIGSRMGMKIWLPRADRSRVLKHWNNSKDFLLDTLPLSYDETTLRTIEQIDVLWLHGRSIVRAFEIEHTTSVYSGILRMADLLALQPNMTIKLHIVAPLSKRDKVFQEIRRPVFSLLERGPLSEICTYISYDKLKELSGEKHLELLSDKVIDKYAEDAE